MASDNRYVTRMARIGIVVLLTLALQACASLQAGTAGRTGLETPEPPPREVVPPPVEPVAVVPTPVIVPAASPAPRSQKPAHQKPLPEKGEPAPGQTPPVGSEPLPSRPTEGVGTGVALQTTADVDASGRRIRDLLAQAGRDLGQIDYRGLSAAGKTQYDAARRFVEQSEEAVRARNFVFAEQLAQKAAGLAAGLLGR